MTRDAADLAAMVVGTRQGGYLILRSLSDLGYAEVQRREAVSADEDALRRRGGA